MNTFIPLVGRLERSASLFPDREALVCGQRRVSYGQLWADVLAFAGFLRAAGLRRQDRVAIVSENSPEYVIAYYGTLAAGGVAVGLDPAARARELNCWIDHCAASWVFADPRHADFQQLVRPALAERVMALGPAADAPVWDAVLRHDGISPGEMEPEQPAAILYTSGTTGRPKGVMLSHGNLSANAASIIEYLGLTSDERVLNVLPFFYSYGGSVLHTHLAVGGTLVLENSMVYPQRVLARMAEERVTGFPGVPSTFSMLLNAASLRTADLSALRYCTQAGGAMRSTDISRVRDLLPHVRFFVMYGQTEATARLTYLPPDRLTDKLGSVGIPIPGVSLQVRDDEGRPVAAGQPGEVHVRGANVMLGYYGDVSATEAVLRDGWLRTADMGYLDADGYLYLVGRRTDIIKSGAHRISPLAIEEVISALPEVADVAVVGIPDEVLGEAIKAIVALRGGATLDQLDVRRHCSLNLPRHKVPKIVEFVERLPRTSSGKIMRFRLTGPQGAHDHETRTA